MSSIPFDVPFVPGRAERPVWTGTAFRIGDETRRILCFEVGRSGWTEDLTELHAPEHGEHPMDRASRRNAIDQIRRFCRLPAPCILEVGVSLGYFLRDLTAAVPEATVIGADYTAGTLEAVASTLPSIPLLQFDLTRCPLPDACVDVVVLLNVLEHIEDDTRALSETHRILKPGGIAVIEVPAGPGLYDFYDKHLMHFRRYRIQELVALAETVGFEVLCRSHLGCLIYPAFWAAKKLNRWRWPADEDSRRARVERSIRSSGKSPLLSPLMRLDYALRRHFALPFGVRCLLTCRRA